MKYHELSAAAKVVAFEQWLCAVIDHERRVLARAAVTLELQRCGLILSELTFNRVQLLTIKCRPTTFNGKSIVLKVNPFGMNITGADCDLHRIGLQLLAAHLYQMYREVLRTYKPTTATAREFMLEHFNLYVARSLTFNVEGQAIA